LLIWTGAKALIYQPISPGGVTLITAFGGPTVS